MRHLATAVGTRLLEAMDARLLIEPHIAYLGAVRSVPDRGCGCLGACFRPAGATGEDIAGFEVPGADFHRVLATLSGSAVFIRLIEPFLDSRRPGCALVASYDRGHKSQAEHQEIVGALVAGEAQRASYLVRDHLQRIRSAVADRLRQGAPTRTNNPQLIVRPPGDRPRRHLPAPERGRPPVGRDGTGTNRRAYLTTMEGPLAAGAVGRGAHHGPPWLHGGRARASTPDELGEIEI